MKYLLLAVIALSSCQRPAFAQIRSVTSCTVTNDCPKPDHHIARKLWIASQFFAVGATAYDASQSWNARESNPLLSSHGRFEARGLTIKLGLIVGLIAPQHAFIRGENDLYKPMTALNMVFGAGYIAAGRINRK